MNFTNDNLAAESYDVADSQEINSYEDYSTDLKFRSIAVESAPTHDDFFFEPEGNAYHDTSVDFSKPYNITSKSDVVPMIITSSSSDASCGTCPDVPFGISNNQFIINKSDYREVVQAISDNLVNQHPHHDFSFIEREHMWKGKYLSGSSSFEMDINLYHNRTDNNYVVGVRKIKSDCCLQSGGFRSFYDSFKSALSSAPSLSSSSSSSVRSSTSAAPPRKRFVIPSGFKYSVAASCPSVADSASCSTTGAVADGSNSRVVTERAFLEGVRPAMKMALCCLENRIQGAKMLCDVSKKEAHYLELPEFHSEVVRVLEALVQDDSDEVRQYAVMAVAAFAELASYKEAFLHSSILPALFGLVENCTNLELAYQMAQVRRTAASVLAVMCRTQPFTVRMELQKQRCDVHGWLQRVSCLRDSRTRESAMICKQFLEDVSVSAETTVEDCMTSEDFATLIH